MQYLASVNNIKKSVVIIKEESETNSVKMDVHVKAITTDYNIAPRIDYRTVLDVEGPLVVLDNVKFPKYAEIVNVRLGDGSVRKG